MKIDKLCREPISITPYLGTKLGEKQYGSPIPLKACVQSKEGNITNPYGELETYSTLIIIPPKYPTLKRGDLISFNGNVDVVIKDAILYKNPITLRPFHMEVFI